MRSSFSCACAFAAVLPIIAALGLAGSASGQCDPAIIGSVNTPAGDAIDVAVSGTLAYVVDASFDESAAGLRVIDVSNPANPVVLGSVDTPQMANAFGVAVSGTVAYVAATFAGLQVIDVSDPANPTIIDFVPTPNDGASDVAVSGTVAYVADVGGLVVIDVSDPADPAFVGGVPTPGSALGVAVVGAVAYVGDADAGLQVIDVSDPANPAIIGSVDTPDEANGVAVSGTVAYVADLTSLQVIDVSDPANPAIIGSVTTPAGAARRVTVSGTIAYVPDGSSGLQVIDVSDPTNPTIIGSVDTPGAANGVAVSGTVAYVANGTQFQASLQTVDLSSCLFGGCCVDAACYDLMIEANCLAVGGTFLGGGSTCDAGSCSNDDCADAFTIADGDTAFSTIGATTDGPALPPACEEGSGLFYENDIWYRYTPAASGTLTVSTCNQADYDTRLASYTGTCGALAFAACNDDGLGCAGFSSLMEVTVTCGVPVLIRVGGYDFDSGTGTLTLTLATCMSDLDGNGSVGFGDLTQILSDWGACP